MFYHIYNADSRSLQEVEDNSVDLVVTSPPYFSAKDYGSGALKGEIGCSDYKCYIEDMTKVFNECARVLRTSRFMCINISNILVNTETVPLPYDYFNILRSIEGLTFVENIIWRKPEGTTAQQRAGSFIMRPYPRRIKLNRIEEFIFVFRKGSQDLTALDIESGQYKDSIVDNKMELLSNMWYFPCVSAVKENHPAPYPEELPRRCIQLFSFKNEVVLDPFNGSGTTGLAAKHLERSYIGYDISEKFIEVAKKKIGFGDGNLFGDAHEYKIIKR